MISRGHTYTVDEIIEFVEKYFQVNGDPEYHMLWNECNSVDTLITINVTIFLGDVDYITSRRKINLDKLGIN